MHLAAAFKQAAWLGLLTSALVCGATEAVPAASAAQAPAPTLAVLPEATPTDTPSAAPDALPSNPPVSPPLPPAAPMDSEPLPTRGLLWNRIRSTWAMPDLDGDRVLKWEQYYARQPDYVQRMVTRGGRYLFHIVEELEKRNMPSELALLPFIESAFNPQAQSRVRASGMWQFMPATGKDFELRQNIFRDDRRDVLASTRAALDYLQRLYGMFNDWHLALAAYNWGQGNVARALASNKRKGLAADYSSLSMPLETRDYVPKLQAMKNIVVAPDRMGLALPPLDNHAYFQGVAIKKDIDVALAARLAGMTLEDFQSLNPQMNKPVILAAGVPQVLLPYDNALRFERELPLVQGPLASWTAWTVPRTLKPADAAKQAGMSEAQLREVNHIPERMLVKAGSTLLVPRSAKATADVAGHLAEHATMVLAPEGRPLRRVNFKAGKGGDSVAAVAKRYKLSAAQVAQWNNTSADARFKPGQPVVVMLAAAPARKHSAAKSAPGKPAGKAGKPSTRTRGAKAAPR